MKTPGRYILNEKGEPIPEPSLINWALWMEENERHVGDETIGPARVSTVFLGLDYQFGQGPPILWETLVFGGELDSEMDRCAGSREQAEAMHARMAARVRAAEHIVTQV